MQKVPAGSGKIVYFVRHGQSVDNVSPVFQAPNSPLSEAGEQQAIKIAGRLKHLEFDALLASPWPRAKQTAQAIAATTGKEITFSELLVERIKPTSVDGKSWDDPEALHIYEGWEKTLYSSGDRVENGENFDDVVARAIAILDMLQQSEHQKIVVVTHGFLLRTIVAQVLLGDALDGPLLKRFQQLASIQNTAITALEYREAYDEQPAWRLWTYNDHAHFADN